jgi:hypothetical protein
MSELPKVTEYDQERFSALDGQRVVVEATYEKTIVTKRPGGAGEVDLTRPGTVKLRLADGYALMLEIYYEAEGTRPLDEIQRCHGKRVRVVGTFHAFTPTAYSEDGHELQTMINAYVGWVESIDLIDG